MLLRKALYVVPLALLLAVGAGRGRADEQPDLRKVIDKAIKAHGGADKLAKFKAATLKLKGKYYGMSEDGVDFTGDAASQSPDKTRMEITIDVMGMEFKFLRVVNGDKGWTHMMGQTTAMDKEALAEAKEELYAAGVKRLAVLRDKGFKLEPLGEVKVGDRAAVGVKVAHKGHRDINLFFDKKTGLLVKSERPAKDPMAGTEFTQTELYDDYKEVDGIKHAGKLTILRDGKKFVDGQSSDFKPQEKLDDSLFAKP
jgi:hypothetical protein